MNKVIHTILILSFFVSCSKTYEGAPGVGGRLPSNFISIKDSAFTPAILTVATGSSITFVNNTVATKTIIGTDSTIIPRTLIEAGGSFLFIKNTSGFFDYHLADKPSVSGTINLTP